ncbi:helix-turn-helix domain-containing protein [Ferruginibacter albus]|uniref:helix-turn-helix domain-containing protein n=1 Tax=Ferruginibacter albus TaxID=2875540 RepID=UPI001CC5F149|nr:helix-turn-helix domain-containing protein [Ferruginibacter albus]UAY52601.1 helix-turn-helix domain-containing protein [Ferruginibacter albus]
MLYLNIQRVAALRNITNLRGYLIQNGFSSNIAHRIAHNADSNIKFHYLEKLCILFHCTPNDLLQWKPDASANILENEPLKNLDHPSLGYLKNITIEELTTMHQKLSNKEG